MIDHRLSRITLFLLLLLSIQTASAQTATFSPYSRYGIGEMIFKGYAWQRGMGGISSGVQKTGHLNFGNPASYVADTVTIFELGLNLEAVNLANSVRSQNKANGNISYLSMGFPIKKNSIFLAMGYVPFSATGYNIRQVTEEPLPGDGQNFYQGNGAYNRFYAGLGFKITKDFWAGFNASYLYGTTNRSTRVDYFDDTYLSTRVTSSTTVSDILPEGGLMYNKKLKNGRLFTAGLSFSPEVSIRAKKDEIWLTYFLRNTTFESKRDTIVFNGGVKGQIRMPWQVGGGFSFANGEKWLIGFDARFQQWERLAIYGADAEMNNTMTIATGGQWTPDAKSSTYFSTITYRIGGYYNSPQLTDFTRYLGGVYLLGDLFDTPALVVKSSDINEAGITLGLGFPLRGKPYFSDLDVTFEYSERGTIKENLVRERYFRINLGLTLREEWFHKTQFD